jgi:hypothetical protein
MKIVGIAVAKRDAQTPRTTRRTRPGHKPAPPVPRWARDRQRRAAGRPGR